MAIILVASYGDGTPSVANFTSAYNAASAGDTVRFPLNGTNTWSSSVTIGKAITIDGNGTALTAGTPLTTGFFYVTGFTSSGLMRITGFSDLNCVNFTGSCNAITVANGGISLTQLRIDHNTFHFGVTTIVAYGSLGSIDNNTFYNPQKAIDFSAGSRAAADASWVSMAAGTSSALFIETNQFTYDGNYIGTGVNETIGTEDGGKLVVRYNNWTATATPGGMDGIQLVMLHGNAAGGASTGYWEGDAATRRGQSVFEMYNNTASGVRIDYLCILRGSACLVHDNTLDTQTNNPRVLLREEEAEPSSPGDQFYPTRTVWPAEDQVHNSHFYGNTLRLNGTPNASYVEVYDSNSATFIQEGRDFFMYAPTTSGGSETFTGSKGGANTAPTDGSTYPNAGNMVYTGGVANFYNGYTPYTYPYPWAAATGPVRSARYAGKTVTASLA